MLLTMVESQLASEVEDQLNFTWKDFIYEDFAYDGETTYGNETEEFKPGHNLRE